MEEGADHCPRCGRRVYRICYCGWRIPVYAERCPQCDADWSASMRVRKKAHTHKVNPKRLASYAMGGALGALLLALLLGALINSLAARTLEEGQSLPSSVTDRLGLAAVGLGQALGTLGQHFAHMSGALAVVLTILVVGAGVGAFLYFSREHLLSLELPRPGQRKHRHRRRRVR